MALAVGLAGSPDHEGDVDGPERGGDGCHQPHVQHEEHSPQEADEHLPVGVPEDVGPAVEERLLELRPAEVGVEEQQRKRDERPSGDDNVPVPRHGGFRSLWMG